MSIQDVLNLNGQISEAHRESIKINLSEIYSFLLRFEENRKKIVFIFILIYYLFIHTYLLTLSFA